MNSANSILSMAIAVSIILVLTPFGEGALHAKPHEQPVPEEWQALLQCNLTHSPACLRIVKSHEQKYPQDNPIHQLANVIIDEWGFGINNPILHKPRKVWIPFPTLDELRKELDLPRYSVIVVASVTVAPDGTVKDREILRSSGFADLDRTVLCAISNGLFRPARKGAEYTTAQTHVLFRTEVR